MTDSLRERGAVVRSVAEIITHGGRDLETLPGLIIRVVDEEMWRQRAIPQLSWRLSKEFASFEEFVTTPPLDGLDTTIDTLRDLCKRRKEALDAIDRATGHNQGKRTDLLYNIQEVKAPTGTGEARALRRLRKDRPDLHARVLAGELKANAAMITAGFWPKMISVPITRPDAVARSLRKHMSSDDLAKLIAVLAPERAPGT